MKKVTCPCCGRKYPIESIKYTPTARGDRDTLAIVYPCRHSYVIYNINRAIYTLKGHDNNASMKVRYYRLLKHLPGRIRWVKRHCHSDTFTTVKINDVVRGEPKEELKYMDITFDTMRSLYPNADVDGDAALYKTDDGVIYFISFYLSDDRIAVQEYLEEHPDYGV